MASNGVWIHKGCLTAMIVKANDSLILDVRRAESRLPEVCARCREHEDYVNRVVHKLHDDGIIG